MKTLKFKISVLLALIAFGSVAQAETVWYPLPPEAYSFGKQYPEAQKLLFAFDYGHALVYERLLLNKGKTIDSEEMERQILKEVFAILHDPPAVKVDEGDIAPNYVYNFPLVLNLFDWSHLLHQFVFDILANSEDRGPKMTARINEIFEQYKANKAIAITEVCKSMIFMDGQPFSKTFRRSYPSFNLLIWTYHMFQARIYEALMKPTKAERDRAVAAEIKYFWELVSDLPDSADFDMMPGMFEEAPTFSRRFPLIAASFDNNHMLHDVVSDILASDKIRASAVRGTGIAYGRMMLDPEAFKASKCTPDGIF
jgi:hypothetical protein